MLIVDAEGARISIRHDRFGGVGICGSCPCFYTLRLWPQLQYLDLPSITSNYILGLLSRPANELLFYLRSPVLWNHMALTVIELVMYVH